MSLKNSNAAFQKEIVLSVSPVTPDFDISLCLSQSKIQSTGHHPSPPVSGAPSTIPLQWWGRRGSSIQVCALYGYNTLFGSTRLALAYRYPCVAQPLKDAYRNNSTRGTVYVKWNFLDILCWCVFLIDYMVLDGEYQLFN